MISHNIPHPPGLADGCERCAEHAASPTVSLDQETLREVMRLAVYRSLIPRSGAEAVAAANVLTLLERFGRLAEAAPELCEQYLRERWHLNCHISKGDETA